MKTMQQEYPNQPSIEITFKVFEPGDLVRVNDFGIRHFCGKLALIVSNMGHDITDHSNGWYYKVTLDSGMQHIFYHRELDLVSKAKKD